VSAAEAPARSRSRRLLPALAVLAIALASAALLFFASLRPPPPLAAPRQGLRLSDVTLIEPGVARAERRSLRVAGDRIEAIEAAREDPGDPFRGAFVLPGLVDLHVHFPPAAIPGQTELFALLFLRHGVTAVRDAGDVDGTASEPARRGAAEARFPGPRVFACGPFVDGEPPVWRNSRVVRTPEEARRAADEIADAGFDCIKAYDRLAAGALAALREAAHRRGLPVIGHVPWRVAFEEARLDDVQHPSGIARAGDALPPPYPEDQAAWLTLGDARLDFAIAESLRQGIAHTPTLVTRERLAGLRDYARMREEADAQLLPRFYRDLLWNPDGGITPAARLRSADGFAMLAAALEAQLEAVARMHAAGVRLHTGSDTLTAFTVPGASLHRELRLFVRAGLSPEQALALSTRDSAQALRVPALGSLAPGAPAELLILREDPTLDLAALDTLLGVVRGGRLYTRAALDADLARRKRHFEGSLFDRVTTWLVRRAIAANRTEEP
jgi:imidazolonepropionase-like amidohydrolase